MTDVFDADSFHRTAKYFMDSGRAERPEDAIALLNGFGLTVVVGAEVATSVSHQTALLTLVNTARRTFLAGIDVIGIPDCVAINPLSVAACLADAVIALGGSPVADIRQGWPAVVIGTAPDPMAASLAWQLTWEGWRGGVTPRSRAVRLGEDSAVSLAPALAAAIAAAEVFAHHAGDHPMAGKRALGLSLWDLTADWLAPDEAPTVAYLPSRLWIVGLGNLGQAFAWLLATLPFRDRTEVQLVLQDFDRIAKSNDSTSLLSFLRDIGRRKARVVADWLDRLGFDTYLEERSFGSWIQRTQEEPAVALCGVDNANARADLEDAGFDLVIEVGLGGGTQAFRSISLHTFPATRTAREVWTMTDGEKAMAYEDLPAYQALKEAGMDDCGLAQLASRTVGVPFVGLIAACLAVAELLRRLNGGQSLEFAAGSAATMEFETGASEPVVYAHGFVTA